MEKITDLKGKGTLQVQGIICSRGWTILLYTQSLILKNSSIISNDFIHIIVLPHCPSPQIFGDCSLSEIRHPSWSNALSSCWCSPLSQYSSFFFATIYQSSKLYVVVANQWERMLLPRQVCRLVSSNLSLEWQCAYRHLATLPKRANQKIRPDSDADLFMSRT